MQASLAVREPVGVPEKQIGDGLIQLAESAGRNITPATVAVYVARCGSAMTASEWRAVVAEALDTVEGWPSVARLLRIHRELRESAADANPTEAELEAEQRRLDAQAGATA